MWAAGKILQLHKSIISIDEEPDENTVGGRHCNILFFNELGMSMTAHADPTFDWDSDQKYKPGCSLP